MEVDLRVGVLTLSDKASLGQREDESGTLAVSILEADGFSVAKQKIVPDDTPRIIDTLRNWVDRDRLPLIITSGGTGLSPTDVTPQAMKEIIDYEVPGIAEAMRACSRRDS